MHNLEEIQAWAGEINAQIPSPDVADDSGRNDTPALPRQGDSRRLARTARA